jgi:hypothetical protein
MTGYSEPKLCNAVALSSNRIGMKSGPGIAAAYLRRRDGDHRRFSR